MGCSVVTFDMDFYPHRWRSRGRRREHGRDGTWFECEECGFRYFTCDGYTDFQVKITVIMAFSEWITSHPVESLADNLSELDSTTKFGMRRGVHADIADYCDYFQWIRARQTIEVVQES